MLRAEYELVLVIYLLYLIECIHWLKPGEMALARSRKGWNAHVVQEDSYTLLGRMPSLANPIDLRASFVTGRSDELVPIQGSIAGIIADDFALITFLAYVGALNLLILLPVLLITGYLGAWWRLAAAVGVFVQVALATEVLRIGEGWRRTQPASFWQQFTALVLNPLASLRAADVLLKGLISNGVRDPI